jgi:hypothetical protein
MLISSLFLLSSSLLSPSVQVSTSEAAEMERQQEQALTMTLPFILGSQKLYRKKCFKKPFW